MDRRNLLKAMTATGLALGPFASTARAEPPGGRWRRYESANFVAFSAAPEASAANEVASLEAFHDLLTKFMPSTQARSPLKLPVYFAATPHDFDVTAPWAGDTIAGFYSSNLEEIRAVVAVAAGRERQSAATHATGSRLNTSQVRVFDARLILFHEYVHHFMYANMRAAFPRWYVEGFAEYLSTAQFTNEGVYIGKVSDDRGSWLVHGGWLPMEKLLNRKPTDKFSAEDEAMFYAQAWLTVHYFFNTPERAQGFDKYIKALTAGGDLLGAFEPAFGISVDTFDKELRAYKQKGLAYRLLPGVKVDTGMPISATRLSSSADDLLLPTSYARERPDPKYGADTLKLIRSLAARYPGDPFAMRAQATAEIWLGDLGVARQQMDAVLKVDAQNAESLHLSGLCDLRAAYAAKDNDLFARASASFARAHNLDETRASSMFRYVECQLRVTGQIDDDLLNVLMAAYKLAPQVDSIAMTLAHALMEHKRFGEAVIVLRPLASDAHGGEMSKKAGEVIAAALAGKEIDHTFYGSAA